MENPNRAEAERLLGIAEKFLHARDLPSAREFAILAQENEPLLDGSDQVLAVADVLLASEKRVNNNHRDWYSILQLDRRCEDHDLIKKQYRRLALLLHPDKNKFPLADQAFKLVADSWSILSDATKKSAFDGELGLFAKVDLSVQQTKLPVRKGSRRASGAKGTENPKVDVENPDDQRRRLYSFWTACPYCFLLYEYPRVYEGCCLRCQNCKRAFQAVLIKSLPPLVPGQEAYYCCWGFFPMGFVLADSDSGGGKGGPLPPVTPTPRPGFPSWMPPMFANGPQEISFGGWAGADHADVQEVNAGAGAGAGADADGKGSGGKSSGKKRGRGRRTPSFL